MLKFYYSRLSINARRVWVTLLEKNLEFEPVLLKLNGDQFKPDFLQLNPFHHIPVLIDRDFKIFESLAILDYLEAKYSDPSFMPTNAEDIAKVRMIELVTVNELPPASIVLMKQMLDLTVEEQKIKQAEQSMATVLQYFEDSLIEDQLYLIQEQLTYADIVAGTAVAAIPNLGISLKTYPKVTKWIENLNQRSSWQQTAPSSAEIEQSKAVMKAILQKR
ncbi:glutathione S-transferase family protein [Pleurocapsa sp. CCALA 161]|uniref:glutathione S-transferase family protein n=1 Tax=Pleurocapsa sp. CCALA 161 TaxID=2107688 RepID=UPI000D07C9F7|nr:glutathione S-transferase family protein [Pleurocapsa sp. CCALA 161]PSB10711.1 glutathione S-transferase family protein [Pleurocapsa sp. CCALA 161]